MAPKSGEKKPAKKVVKKTGASAGDKKKKVSRKAVESYKIYIYKVGFCVMQQHVVCCVVAADYAHVIYKLSRNADPLASPCRCSSRSTLTLASAPRP